MKTKLCATILSLVALSLGLLSSSSLETNISPMQGAKLPYEEYLQDVANETWRCITHFMDPNTGLPYDRSDQGGSYTSTTNTGLYMACTVAALQLGFITRGEAIARVNRTLNSINKIGKWSGFPHTWYDAITLNIIDYFISTEHLGWFAEGLMLTRSALPELWDRCTSILDAMNWTKLYDPNTCWLYGGYDPIKNEYAPWHYCFLGADSRAASFVSIGTGKVPLVHWQKLIRDMEERYGIEYLVPGWQGGGLFMQLMAGLFIDERGTLAGRSGARFAYAQMLHAKKIESPVWGWSSSDNPDGGYLGWGNIRDDVVTPHASILALYYYPCEAVENMKKLEAMGARPEQFGFRDSVNVKTGKVDDSYLVLDQGMIMLSIANYLTWGAIWRISDADPITQNAKQLIPEFHLDGHTKQAMELLFENVTYGVVNAKIEGYTVSSAEEKLIDAKLAFNDGRNSLAMSLANEAILKVELSKNATITMNRASAAISKAEGEGRTKGLDEAKNLLQQAMEAYKKGEYPEAIQLAQKAEAVAQRAQCWPPPMLMLLSCIAAILVAAIIGIVKFKKKFSGQIDSRSAQTKTHVEIKKRNMKKYNIPKFRYFDI